MVKVSFRRAMIALFVFGAVCAGTVIGANGQSSSQPNTDAGETPELGRAGSLGVGTSVVQYSLPQRAKITMMGALTGRLPVGDRQLSVRFWYPANPVASATRASYRHVVSAKGKPDFVINTQGVAVENSAPLQGQKYPLVVMSHGYRAWASHFSNLAENLASKGYVVASIEHDDASFDSVTSFQMSFGNVMLDRSQDQRQIITQMLAQATGPSSGVPALIDVQRVGLIGYSMGGFGALATAGAPYDATSKTFKQLPNAVQTAIMAPTYDVAPQIRALVLLAPWGGQPDNRSWSAADLAKITAPVMVISGDQDDVVDFDHGVSWLFDNLKNADRHMLVYRDARHNIAGNPVPITPTTDFSTLEFFTEPVWRTERLNQNNQHFITAFLDLQLKGDATKARFLNVPVATAAQGAWPSKLGEQLGGKFADDAQSGHWQGYQRRWAMGMTLHKAVKGSAAKTEPALAVAP